MTPTKIHLPWRTLAESHRFHTAVSLHSHTMHSRENLEFAPRIGRTIPIVRQLLESKERSYERRYGHAPDYANAWWTPPLSEREAWLLESRQIEQLELRPLISLTDHDNIDAAMHLHLFDDYRHAPVSVEWTVPTGGTFVHIGVHNLPRAEARSWMDAFAAYTKSRERRVLCDLLAALHDRLGVLIVLNHPLWDEMGIGPEAHLTVVRELLGACGRWIDALELNGMRSWAENRAVIALARSTGHPAISGGDRHGSEPNVLLNLTNAATFEEFATEIRSGAPSEVLVRPAYYEPLNVRRIEAIWDIVREYPEQSGRVRWTDRCFYLSSEGNYKPLSSVWRGDGPGIVGTFMTVLRVLASPQVLSALRTALRNRAEVLS